MLPKQMTISTSVETHLVGYMPILTHLKPLLIFTLVTATMARAQPEKKSLKDINQIIRRAPQTHINNFKHFFSIVQKIHGPCSPITRYNINIVFSPQLPTHLTGTCLFMIFLVQADLIH